jgi:hypothetical protein
VNFNQLGVKMGQKLSLENQALKYQAMYCEMISLTRRTPSLKSLAILRFGLEN